MDLIEATERSIVRKIDGRECTFSFLTAYDRATLMRGDLLRRREAWQGERQRRRELLIENLKLAGISGEQMFAELEAFEDREPRAATERDWIAYVNALENELDIFAASLRPAHGDEAEALARRACLTLEDKARVCGLEIVDREQPAEPAAGGGEPAGQLPPPAYGRTAGQT